MAESVILFIEDEDDHFEALKEHLEPDFKCARSHALGVEAVAKEVQGLKPVAVVLDLMLFTSSGAAKAAATAFQRSIAALEELSRSDELPKYSATAVDASTEIPNMANDWLRELKRKCPGIPIIAFSQLEATVISLEGLVADAIAKRLDTNTSLLNGKEFAGKVRELIKG
jgi:CheY-like chemotaxis protein